MPRPQVLSCGLCPTHHPPRRSPVVSRSLPVSLRPHLRRCSGRSRRPPASSGSSYPCPIPSTHSTSRGGGHRCAQTPAEAPTASAGNSSASVARCRRHRRPPAFPRPSGAVLVAPSSPLGRCLTSRPGRRAHKDPQRSRRGPAQHHVARTAASRGSGVTVIVAGRRAAR